MRITDKHGVPTPCFVRILIELVITPDYSAAVGTEVVNRNVKLSPIANCNAPMFNSLKWKMITQDQDPKLDTQVKLPNKITGQVPAIVRTKANTNN